MPGWLIFAFIYASAVQQELQYLQRFSESTSFFKFSLSLCLELPDIQSGPRPATAEYHSSHIVQVTGEYQESQRQNFLWSLIPYVTIYTYTIIHCESSILIFTYYEVQCTKKILLLSGIQNSYSLLSVLQSASYNFITILTILLVLYILYP